MAGPSTAISTAYSGSVMSSGCSTSLCTDHGDLPLRASRSASERQDRRHAPGTSRSAKT